MDPTFIDRALGSDIPYITYAVPVFFLLIGVELVVALWERKHYYRLHDSINDLSCGSTEQIVGIFLKGLLFAGYQGTYALRDPHGDQPDRRPRLLGRRQVAGGDPAVPRGRLCLLLVPPHRPRVQRPLGRARGAPFE